ncbi:MAG: hypothetical protein SF029_13225 [bacterium]|nr:hypothetical protein [bacterium]
MRLRFIPLLSLILCFLTLTLNGSQPARAQFLGADSGSPLHNLLAQTPNTLAARDTWIRFQDYAAAFDAIEWLERPERLASYLEEIGWVGFFYRWLSAPEQITSLLFSYDDTLSIVGFDLFDVDQTLTFGNPPSEAVLWRGRFNAESIAAVHEARGYTQERIDGVDAWCGPQGCASGMQVDLPNRDPNNIFDNGLGRPVPFLLLPDADQPETLVSSPNLAVLEQVAAVTNGDTTSLAEAPDYLTLANALNDPVAYPGLLIGAQFLPTEQVRYRVDFTQDDPFADFRDSPIVNALQRLSENDPRPDFLMDYATLPEYQMAAIADRQEGDRQLVIVALLYENAAEAEVAAPELARRLESFSAALTRRAPNPLLEDVPGAVVVPRVYTDSETGLSVALVEIGYDTPTQAQQQATAASGELMSSGRVFQILLEAFAMNELYPLWIVEG